MSWSTTGEVFLAGEGGERLRRGQRNIYVKWLSSVRGPVRRGDLVVIRGEDGETLGLGFYEDIGAMAVRVLSTELEEPRQLFRRRLGEALGLRERLKLDNFFRWVHSEADALPGLIVDVYDDVVVISSTSVGMDRRLDDISAMISEIFRPGSVILRNDSRPRREVGLPQERRILMGNRAEAVIREGGALFHVDALRGQKTGFFIDQRLNRMEVDRLAGPGDRVLDLYSYTGGFAVHAALSGARVVAVEESEYAVGEMRRNMLLNSIELVPVQSRVKDFLEGSSEVYDLVVVDPPALAPSREMLSRAKRTYTAVNASAMERVASGGLMFTSSCSQFITKDEFRRIATRAASLSGREITVLGERGASPDHPVDPAHPWTGYLKGLLLRVE